MQWSSSMFQSVLRISLYSADPLLEGAFKALQADAEFRHKISFSAEVQSLFAEAQAKEDIYFLGPEHLVSLPGLKKAAKPTARIVLIDTAGQEATLPKNVISLLNEIWPLTNNRALMAMRVKNLLNNALLDKKYAQLQRCLDTTIDTTPDLIWFKDIRGAHLKVNDAFCNIVGKSKADVTGRGHYYIWDITPDEYTDGEYVCLESEEEVIARAETCIFDEVVKTQMGMRQFKTRKSPIFDEDEKVIGTVGIAYDMTDITNSSAEVDIILQNLPFAAIILDANDKIVNTNQKFLDFFHFQSTEEIIGSYRSRLRDVAIQKHKLKQIGDRLEVRSWDDGKEIILESYERKILDIFKNRIGLLVIYRDVTQERNSQQELEHNANTDELTGLFNRRYFYNNLPEIGQAGTSMLFVDLDNFKEVNDTYGHRAGDDALKLTARLLRENFAGALIARMGGDEFVLYLNKTHTAEQVVKQAYHLQKAMKAVFAEDTPWEGLSASIGIVVIETHGISRDEMVRRGDIAMYEAKRLGKRRICQYSPDIEAQQEGSFDTLCAKPRSSCRRLDTRQAKSNQTE